MPVYIKKFQGNNYFRDRVYLDSIVLTKLPEDSFPRFGYETENSAGVGQYRAGDFDLKVFLLNSETSVLGYNMNEFLFPEDRDFYLLVIVASGSQYFSGTVKAGKISADKTYTQSAPTATMIVKDIMLEWAARCEIAPNSTINWGGGTESTFENYIYMHFAGLTSDIVLLGLPVQSYLSRLQPYGSPGHCLAYKDFYDFITDQVNISRWETFKELAKGIAFNFEMYINPGTEGLNEPEFIFKIFFITDILDEDPIEIKVIKHKEFTTEERLEWLFLRYRHYRTNLGYTNSQGVVVSADNIFYTDTDQSTGLQEYPAVVLTLNDKLLSVLDANSNTIFDSTKDIDYTEFELKNYAYSVASGGGIGKLVPPTQSYVASVGISYCHIFHAVTGLGIGRYDFNPIQRYAVTQYKRYLKGLQKTKSLIVAFNSNTNIKLWKKVILDDGHGDEAYYISAVRNIDLKECTAEIELIKLFN